MEFSYVCVIIHNSYHLSFQSSWYIKLVDAWWWIISFFNQCFPVDKYDTLEYS
jgi:hypothetical protein